MGHFQEALAAFQAANDLDPGNPLACRGLSRVYREEKREAEGEAILKTVIEHRSDYFEAQRLLALYYFRTGEETAALSQLDKTLALAPNDLYSLNTKGALYVDRGESRRARALFERAYAFAPNCDTCSNIGWALYDDGQYAESASYYELALEYCGEDDPQAWANWARALYWTEGGRQAAKEPFQNAIDLTWEIWNASPGDPEVIGNLIEYHAMVGDRKKTLQLIAMGDSLASDSEELLYQIGDAYELIGERSAALRYLSKAVQHGVPVERIQRTRELADLAADPLFVRMISAESGADAKQAEGSQ
jgi:tetratricopeptide (TPR) repeat protein